MTKAFQGKLHVVAGNQMTTAPETTTESNVTAADSGLTKQGGYRRREEGRTSQDLHGYSASKRQKTEHGSHERGRTSKPALVNNSDTTDERLGSKAKENQSRFTFTKRT